MRELERLLGPKLKEIFYPFPDFSTGWSKTVGKGMYILSGSQNFSVMKNISESLAGRVYIQELYPMCERELDEKISSPSLQQFTGQIWQIQVFSGWKFRLFTETASRESAQRRKVFFRYRIDIAFSKNSFSFSSRIASFSGKNGGDIFFLRNI